MNINELVNQLYTLPCIIKEDPIKKQLHIIFENNEIIYLSVNESSDVDIPYNIKMQLDTEELKSLVNILWHFSSTPVFMRHVDEWIVSSAREAYYINQQLLNEPLGSIERHWIIDEQKELKKLF